MNEVLEWMWRVAVSILLLVMVLLISELHERETALIRAQTTLLKNVSQQLSELRSDFTVLPNPEDWSESEVNKSEENDK